MVEARQVKDDYQFVEKLGYERKSKSFIWRAKSKNNFKEVTMKVTKKNRMTNKKMADLLEELNIRKQLNHSCILNLMDVYEDKERIYHAYELVKGGDLTTNLNTSYDLSERNVQQIMIPLFDAVDYLHERGIMHRDLKPDILQLTDPNLTEASLKIADFKLSCQLKPGELVTNAAGTPFYVAPEIISEQFYDQRCDFWSLGVILFLLLSGSLPFKHTETAGLFEKIKAGKYSFSDYVWESVSSEAKDLVKRLLKVEPDFRITREELRIHPWISF